MENKTKARVAIYTGALLIIASALALTMRGDALGRATAGVHATARVAFGYFVLLYIATPVHRTFGWRLIAKYRRELGLCVALALTMHLGFLVAFFGLSAERATDDALRFITGTIGYALLYAMALTSNNAAKRKLGRWWKTLHRIGLHYLLGFFLASYVLEAGSNQSFFAVIALIGACVVWRLALFAVRTSPAPRSDRAPARSAGRVAP